MLFQRVLYDCRCGKIVNGFVALDLEGASDEDIHSFLKDFVLSTAEGIL